MNKVRGTLFLLRKGKSLHTFSHETASESLKRKVANFEKKRRTRNPKKTEVFVEVPESRSFLDTATMPMMLTAVGVALFAKLLMMYDESRSQELIERKIKNAPPGQGTVRMLTREEWEEIREVRPRTPFESKLARPNARIRTGGAVKKTQNGQIYDCVDFYKQPTLQDRRFINHIHQVNITTLQSQAWKVNGLRLKDGCPLGTVPILRSYNISKSSTNIDSIAGKNCIAAIRTSGSRDSFYGASGSVSVYQQLVYGNQRSNSRMRLKDSTDFIEAGWMVNPSLYKDSEAHFYARFSSKTAGGCFNLLCPGFVQVSKDVPLGIIPDRYSKIGEDNQYTLLITIEKHQDDGHWWLSINSNKEAIGYWPKTLFAGSLKEIAFQIEWGGEVDNPESDKTPEPYMGSGLTARDSTKSSAFYCQIQAARRPSQYDNNPKPTEKFQECDSDGYKTYDVDYRGDPWGRLIFFGGPYATMS